MIKNPSIMQFKTDMSHLSDKDILTIEQTLSKQISEIVNKINSNKYRLLIDDSILKTWVEVKLIEHDQTQPTWSITFKGNPDFTKILNVSEELNLLTKIQQMIETSIKSYQ